MFSQTWSLTLSIKYSVMTDGHPDCGLLCTSVLPPLNKQHHLCSFPLFMTPSPYTSKSWWWTSAGHTFFTFKNRITKSTSQSAGLVIDMVLYKALWYSNQFTWWLGKHWGQGRGSDDSSRPSKTSSQWPERAGCTNGSYFKNDLCANTKQYMFQREPYIIISVLNYILY
jgi:hypothetical protein